MTGTYPPWPRPLPMLPSHSSGGPDGDSDQADERARRGTSGRSVLDDPDLNAFVRGRCLEEALEVSHGVGVE
jgi:hypothetical protein